MNRRAVEPAEDALEAKLEQGWSCIEEGDVLGARRRAGDAASLDPSSPEPLMLQAACAREEGQDGVAIELLRQAIRLDPDWATPELWLAELLALDRERLLEALNHAGRALDRAEEEEEFLSALTLKASLELDLGKVDAARATLSELPAPDVELEETTQALEIAELVLACGEREEARQRFQLVADRQPDVAEAWYGLGLVAEEMGDNKEKLRCWKKVRELDGKEDPSAFTSRLSEAEFATVAEESLEELPPRVRELLSKVPVVVADLPSEKDVETGMDPRLLGMFTGTPYSEESAVGGVPDLTQILLFRRNLERVADDEEMLRDEIRTTVLHETGHFFGMDEDDLERVGLD